MLEFILGYAGGLITVLVMNYLADAVLDRYFEERE